MPESRQIHTHIQPCVVLIQDDKEYLEHVCNRSAHKMCFGKYVETGQVTEVTTMTYANKESFV